jgi:DNA (cytosine-5)-methyltransferase 1
LTLRLLDLCCGAGGASVGYSRAGFEVVGVDIAPQPRYPFPFVQADALELLESMSWGELIGYDAIHASPPCQRWARGYARDASHHPDLITPLRELLLETGLPYIIENVPRAPLRDAVLICGGGLGCTAGNFQLHRHRAFEASFALLGVPHTRQRRYSISVVGHGSPPGPRELHGRNHTIAEKQEAMGIDWMTRDELSEAIPPVYTEHVGEQLRRHVLERRASPTVHSCRDTRERSRAARP